MIFGLRLKRSVALKARRLSLRIRIAAFLFARLFLSVNEIMEFSALARTKWTLIQGIVDLKIHFMANSADDFQTPVRRMRLPKNKKIHSVSNFLG